MGRLEVADVIRIALLSVAGWVTAVWLCGAVYIAVTYVEAARHVPPRPLLVQLRWVLRECWVVLWTQPLMLWFQFFGRRLPSGGGDVPIVLVHGYFQNRVDFLYLAHRLRKAGCGPLYACNFFWPQSLTRSSADVKAFIERVRERTGAEAVDLLTHSSGGLFAIDIMNDSPWLVRRAALIAVPACGVTWRGPVLGKSGSQLRAGSLYHQERSCVVGSGCVLSVYSEHDNLVHPVSTSMVEGVNARNVCVEGPGHLSVLFDRRVGDEVCGFLLAE